MLFLVLAGCLGYASAAESENAKLDSLLSLTREIKAEVKKFNPLQDKTMGIELNPVWQILAQDGLALTGGIQVFAWDRHAEFSFPWQVFKDDDEAMYSLDLHYRRFLGDWQQGFYLAGFTRAAYMEWGNSNSDLGLE